jgi:hypothetical protein
MIGIFERLRMWRVREISAAAAAQEHDTIGRIARCRPNAVFSVSYIFHSLGAGCTLPRVDNRSRSMVIAPPPIISAE